jgi:hypothetical protein
MRRENFDGDETAIELQVACEINRRRGAVPELALDRIAFAEVVR